MYALQPRPYSVSHSIIGHTVSISHHQELAITSVAQALDKAGFDVYDEGRSGHRFNNVIEQAIHKWRNDSPDVDSGKRKRHRENCEQCQRQLQESREDGRPRSSLTSTLSTSLVSTVKDSPASKTKQTQSLEIEPIKSVISSEPRLPPRFEAVVSIEGMTCASCTGAITQALETLPWVHSVNISLLTHSATIIFEDEANKDNIIEAIDDTGFNAVLETVDPVSAESVHKSADSKWLAKYAVEGITCSSCVASITKQLEERNWIKDVNVNLLSHSVDVTFSGKDHADRIRQIIEDTGFDVKLDSLTKADVTSNENIRRKLAIRVNGMYCNHCPDKILGVIKEFPTVNIEKPLTFDRPELEISYIADKSNIRTILQAIKAREDVFEPSIYHQQSIEDRSRKMLRQEQLAILYRVVLSLITVIPTFIIGVVYMDLISTHDSGRQYLMQPASGVQRANWAMWILATPVYFYAANIFHRRALRELWTLWRPRSPIPLLRRLYRFGSMNMLISLGSTVAYWSSFAQIMVSAAHRNDVNSSQQSQTYFDSVVFLTLFLLVGRLIESYAKVKTGDAVNALGQMRPSKALLLEETQAKEGESGLFESVKEVSTELVDVGDTIRILPGSSAPCDGIVDSGSSTFDESSLTGESRATTKSKGDAVFAGTVNKTSAINIQVTATVGESMLDQVIAAVREGQTKRAPIERTADILTSYFVPVITITALLVWIIWMSLGFSGVLPSDYLDVSQGGWAFWSLEFAISVFVVACPCGLGLAAPTALFVGSGIAAQHGILVKGGGEAFQEASGIDVVAFDKTGTLTVGGEPKITESVVESHNDKLTLAAVSKIEQDSGHPLAHAIMNYCHSELSDKIKTVSTQEMPGKGVRGVLNVSEVLSSAMKAIEVIVGNEALMADHSVAISAVNQSSLERWKSLGQSIVLAAIRPPPSDKSEEQFTLVASFAAADTIRPESSFVVCNLQDAGISTWMVTGDNNTTAQAVARQVGIPFSNVIAGVLPTEKSQQVKYLQQSQPPRSRRFGRTNKRATVAMVGDGINDAPALAAADVGIALASGADVAVQTAPFVLLNTASSAQLNLSTVLTLMNLSEKVFRRVRFNFAWALVYNVVLVPIAAGVLYPVRKGDGHVRMDPAWAALAMAGSSVSVVVSSLALRWRWLPGVGFRAPKVKDEASGGIYNRHERPLQGGDGAFEKGAT